MGLGNAMNWGEMENASINWLLIEKWKGSVP